MQATNLLLLSNQKALTYAMDIVANNVANANTTGFKRVGIEFDSMITQQAPGQTMTFAVDKSTFRDLNSGPIESTGNPLDVAIHGEGYFRVQTPAGMRYTRGGALTLDNKGQIVNQAGQPMLSNSGQPILVPENAKDINISNDGTITAKVAGQNALTQLGRMGIFNVPDEQLMTMEGGNLYSTDQVATPILTSSVVQGAIEQSNVKPVTEMTQMIQIMRLYEQANNLMKREDVRLDDAINKLSKTTA